MNFPRIGPSAVLCFMLLSLTLALPLPARADAGHLTERTISVNGYGKAKVVPNVVRTRFGISITLPSVGEAMRKNRETISEVLDQLHNLGIEERDILTDHFSLRRRPPYERDGKLISEKYQVDNTVLVFIRDLEKVDRILEQIAASGANNIENLEFIADDTKEAQSLARERAAANAREKAEELARLHGVKLGKVISITHRDSRANVQRRDMLMSANARSDAGFTSPGERTISLEMSVVYEIE